MGRISWLGVLTIVLIASTVPAFGGACEDSERSDVTRNGSVAVDDLLVLLAAWGASDGDADINDDGVVDFIDLVMVLSYWGDVQECSLHVVSRNVFTEALYSYKKDDAPWRTEVIEETYVFGTPNIAIDPAGDPCVAYYSTTLSALRFATRLGPDDWEVETITSCTSTRITPDLVFAADGTAHVVFFDPVNDGLIHVKREANAWQPTLIAPGADVTEVVIQMDDTGTMHIAFIDVFSSSYEEYRYASKTIDGPWVEETIQANTDGGDRGITLALDGTNTPHVAFGQMTPTAAFNKVKYAQRTETGWDVETVFIGNEIPRAENPSGLALCIDRAGTPRLAYGISNHLLTPVQLFYTERVDGSWTDRELVHQYGGASWILMPSMRIDSRGDPVLVDRHRFGTSDQVRRFFRITPGQWTAEVVHAPALNARIEIGQ